MSEEITLEVLRYQPELADEPRLQSYTVPYHEDWVVLDALNHIKDNLDATLSYRWSCHMAICGSCGMMINGEPKLACHAFLRDYRHAVIRVEPLEHFPIERDLVIVMDDFMDKLSSVQPYLITQAENASSATVKICRRRSSSWPSSNTRSASTACCATPPARNVD